MDFINYNLLPPILESDTNFEIVFHYDGAVVTYNDKTVVTYPNKEEE